MLTPVLSPSPATAPGWTRRACTLAATVAVLLVAVPALAQTTGEEPDDDGADEGAASPIVGTWSATLRRSDGQPNGSLFMQMGPGGQFALHTIVPGGETHYAGSYEFDAGSGVLSFVVSTYQGAAPQYQPGVPYRFQLQQGGPDTLLLQDAGGPIELHRQGL